MEMHYQHFQYKWYGMATEFFSLASEHAGSAQT